MATTYGRSKVSCLDSESDDSTTKSVTPTFVRRTRTVIEILSGDDESSDNSLLDRSHPKPSLNDDDVSAASFSVPKVPGTVGEYLFVDTPSSSSSSSSETNHAEGKNDTVSIKIDITERFDRLDLDTPKVYSPVSSPAVNDDDCDVSSPTFTPRTASPHARKNHSQVQPEARRWFLNETPYSASSSSESSESEVTERSKSSSIRARRRSSFGFAEDETKNRSNSQESCGVVDITALDNDTSAISSDASSPTKKQSRSSSETQWSVDPTSGETAGEFYLPDVPSFGSSSSSELETNNREKQSPYEESNNYATDKTGKVQYIDMTPQLMPCALPVLETNCRSFLHDTPSSALSSSVTSDSNETPKKEDFPLINEAKESSENNNHLKYKLQDMSPISTPSSNNDMVSPCTIASSVYSGSQTQPDGRTGRMHGNFATVNTSPSLYISETGVTQTFERLSSSQDKLLSVTNKMGELKLTPVKLYNKLPESEDDTTSSGSFSPGSRALESSAHTKVFQGIQPEHGSHLFTSSDERLNATCFDDTFDGCAWAFDNFNDVMYLASHHGRHDNTEWPEISIPCDLYERLYPHQKAGVQWMASLYSDGIGGILGDDMGMGKTFQTLTYLGGLMRAGTIRNALVVAPVSVLHSWEREARDIIKGHCIPTLVIDIASGDVGKHRRRRMFVDALDASDSNPRLVITTYGVVTSSTQDFLSHDANITQWDVVVLDEGHKIKNPSTAVSKSCRLICRSEKTRRLLLSGTPIQNNLKELWALFDWATSGKLLGKLSRFENHFAIPIENGRNKNATGWTIKTAEKRTDELQRNLRPHFLQRTKNETFGDMLPSKREIVVWTHLSRKQRALYESYLRGEKVASVLEGEVSSPLEAITWLKKLCGHPLLVVRRAHAITSYENNQKLVNDSAKLGVLVALIDRLKKSRHRILVFSQSTCMLDIIERVLSDRVRLSRIDGSTKQADRQKRVDEFNDSTNNISVMLVSTRAGGLGLTLTGADRCVVYDPSWNPAEDSQAVDRCYRISQTRDVTVYRLIAVGTVEETMYMKQVHKDGIRRTVMTNRGTKTERLFDKKNLHKLFELAPPGECRMLTQLKKGFSVTGSSGKPTFLTSLDGVVGVSSHDEVYSGVVNLDSKAESQTPFNGTPAKKAYCELGRSQRALHKENISNFTGEFGEGYRQGSNITRLGKTKFQ